MLKHLHHYDMLNILREFGMCFVSEDNRNVNFWWVSGEHRRCDPLSKWHELFYWEHPMTLKSGVLGSPIFLFFPNVL